MYDMTRFWTKKISTSMYYRTGKVVTFPQVHFDQKNFSKFFWSFYIKMNTSQEYLHSKYKKS